MKAKCLIYHHESKLGMFLPGKTYKLDENDEQTKKMLADFPDKFVEVVSKESLPKLKVKKAKAK